jgi:small subunit ribosomal protein S8
MMTDPISDMLTRLRNANRIHKKRITMPASRLKVGHRADPQGRGLHRGLPGRARRALEPPRDLPEVRAGRRVRAAHDPARLEARLPRVRGRGRLKPVLRGMGIQILSTPKGILSDRTARQENVGGEILCKVT